VISKSLLIAVVLFVSSLAFAGNSNCPEKLEGKWFCHASGMPVDGSDETTYHQTFHVNRDKSGRMISYSANYNYEGNSAYLIIVDNVSRLEKIGPKASSGIIQDISRKYFCADDKLHAHITDFIFKSPADYSKNIVESSSTITLVYVMESNDSYTMSGGSDTDVCIREN
jgi:hypothetical protein